MSKFTFELIRDENHNYRVNVLSGTMPHKVDKNGNSFGFTEPEMLSEFDGCYSPGDALRVFAENVDRAMADAWFEEAGSRSSETA